jgi:surface protein
MDLQAAKWLMPDGSIQTLGGEEVDSADEYRANLYERATLQAAKWLQPDGTVEDYIPTNGQPIPPSNQFITTWRTASNDESIALPLVETGTYDFYVDWGDGTTNHITTYDDPNAVHTYDIVGDYTITIDGTIVGFMFNGNSESEKIKNISQWGSTFVLQGLGFKGCSNLTITATDLPILDPNLVSVFEGCSSVTSIPNINLWNMSVVNNVASMFKNCTSFNQDISSWLTSSITFMSGMFEGCSIFNSPIANWDTSHVVTFSSMFKGASLFNQDISDWNTSAANDFSAMFMDASAFNQPIGGWNTSAAFSFDFMFCGASSFNQNINGWVVSNCMEAISMFQNASSFNQSLNNWSTSFLILRNYMFNGATNFNQDLSSWDMSMAFDISNIFTGSGLTTENYDKILIGWAAQSVQFGVQLDADCQYTIAAKESRDILTGTYGWTINDGGMY